MRFTVLAIALLLCSCNSQPAPLRNSDEIRQLIALADQTLRFVQKVESHASDDDVSADLRKLVTAVSAIRRPQIQVENLAGPTTIRGIDTQAAGKVTACAATASQEFLSIQGLRSILLVQAAMSFTECAVVGTGYLRVVRDQDIADNIGFALAVVYPVAVAIRAKAGLDTRGLLESYQATNDAMIAKMAPKCHKAWVPNLKEWALDTYYECAAYTGETARGKNRESVAAEASRSTSRGVAAAVLAMMKSGERLASHRP